MLTLMVSQSPCISSPGRQCSYGQNISGVDAVSRATRARPRPEPEGVHPLIASGTSDEAPCPRGRRRPRPRRPPRPQFDLLLVGEVLRDAVPAPDVIHLHGGHVERRHQAEQDGEKSGRADVIGAWAASERCAMPVIACRALARHAGCCPGGPTAGHLDPARALDPLVVDALIAPVVFDLGEEVVQPVQKIRVALAHRPRPGARR
jgi:hypothetical protein